MNLLRGTVKLYEIAFNQLHCSRLQGDGYAADCGIAHAVDFIGWVVPKAVPSLINVSYACAVALAPRFAAFGGVRSEPNGSADRGSKCRRTARSRGAPTDGLASTNKLPTAWLRQSLS